MRVLLFLAVLVFFLSCKNKFFYYTSGPSDDNPPPKTDSLYEADFIGGKDSLNKFLKDNTRFSFSQANGVIVQLSVDSIGNVSNLIVRKELRGCDSCAQEALRVLSLVKKMNPAYLINKDGSRTTINSETKIFVPFEK